MKHTNDTHCSATPVADLQVGDLVVRTLDRHGAVGKVVSIDLDYSDPYAVVQFDDGNWSGARLAWTRVSSAEGELTMFAEDEIQACTMCDDSGVADDGSYCEECYS